MNYFSKNTLRRTLALGLASAAVIMTSFSGCKKANPLGLGGCDDLIKKSEEFGTVVQTFSGDPSPANCEKMKKVAQAYLKAARNCNAHPELKKAAEEAIDEWGDIDCSEFAEGT